MSVSKRLDLLLAVAFLILIGVRESIILFLCAVGVVFFLGRFLFVRGK